MNGHLLSEKKKVMDKWKEYLDGKLSDQDYLNIEFGMGEVNFIM